MASMNEGRGLIADDELIERNGRFTGPHGDAEDLRGYFIDTGFHGGLLRTKSYPVWADIIKPARCLELGNVYPICSDRVKCELWDKTPATRAERHAKALPRRQRWTPATGRDMVESLGAGGAAGGKRPG